MENGGAWASNDHGGAPLKSETKRGRGEEEGEGDIRSIVLLRKKLLSSCTISVQLFSREKETGLRWSRVPAFVSFLSAKFSKIGWSWPSPKLPAGKVNFFRPTPDGSRQVVYQAGKTIAFCIPAGKVKVSPVFVQRSIREIGVCVCDRRNTFARFPEDDLHFSWQRQH